jgi:hypothetical protein
VKAGKVHNLQQVQRNHFVQKVGDWSIPRKLTGVDRYYTNVNSLSVPQEKMIYICCITPDTFDATPLTSGGARGGVVGGGGAIAPGRQREGAPKEGGKKFLFIYLLMKQ